MGRHIFAIMLVIWLGFQALVSRASYPIVIRFCPTCNARYDVQQMTFFCRDSLKCRHETIIEACDYKDHWGQKSHRPGLSSGLSPPINSKLDGL
ncbi:hypothetical protein PTTG_26059 [Puccinia triticina 1-1 BBBD Race 1]|uniref:Uncharacterized protein n=1 Tax=Puccinia triticina (isolate 1-1 / race 1 (BBBD)) TaxID=630390 RepID=A0A180GXA6_PUCT1|nr:hypothetical protein PTTG_26059 [Puccinia triticina 1-1 BBBD Race 1]WAR60652.1 hypothetical protein PtB15_9B591 [Puccinia triticina]